MEDAKLRKGLFYFKLDISINQTVSIIRKML